MFFFIQAEDGIRDHCVTGVQTCALPISIAKLPVLRAGLERERWVAHEDKAHGVVGVLVGPTEVAEAVARHDRLPRRLHFERSEERRVGKEYSSVVCDMSVGYNVVQVGYE